MNELFLVLDNFDAELNPFASLKPIEGKIQTVADADEHVHAIAAVIGEALKQIAAIGDTNIRLSTSALSEYRMPMIEDQR